MLRYNTTPLVTLLTAAALASGCEPDDYSAPFVSATVSPAAASPGDALSCTADVQDADEDVESIEYLWSNGSTKDTITVDSEAADGEILTCTVTATDATGLVGSDDASAIVQVGEPDPDDPSAPFVLATVSPAAASPGDALSCTADVKDADDDVESVEYLWSDGSTDQDLIVPDSAADGELLTCTVTATDATGLTGSDDASAIVQVDEPEPVCGSLYFDGTSYVEIAPSADLPSGDEPRTVMFWTRAETRAVVNLVTLGDGMTTNARFSVLLENSYLKVVGQNHDYFFYNDSIDDEWSHVAVTYDGAELSLYEDGELIETEAVSSAFDTASAFEMIIGANSLDRDDEFFIGNISDVRIWSRALSSGEIGTEHSSVEADPAQLVGHWPLSDGAGSTAEDISGSGLDGVIQGAQWDSDCP